MMPAFLDRFGTKPSSKLQTPPNTNSKVSSRPISPAASPPQPQVNLPRVRTISNVGVGHGSSVSIPNLILTHEDDSQMSVSTPGSLHRADSYAAPIEPPREKSLSANSKSQHQRVAGMVSPEADLSALTPHQSGPSQVPDPNANGSRSRKPSAVTPLVSGPSQGQSNESLTKPNGSRRSGSVSSTSTEGQTVTYLPLQLVESPKSDGHGSAHSRQRSASTVSEKESGRALAVNNEHEVKKRKSWRRPSAAETSPQFSPFQLQTAPTLMSKKPQTRHQSTMGMGLASALAASGLGVIPPSHVVAFSPAPGQGVNMPLHNRTSVKSLPRSRASLSPVRSKGTTNGRPRDASNSIRSTVQSVDGAGGSDSDDSDYDSGDALDFGDDDIPITGFAVATMKRNLEFHELFPTIPADDYLIDDYGCALQRDILIQGRLYISENHMCFYANIFGWVTTLVLPFSNVKAIEKRMTAFVIPNAIGVTENSNKYTFASFLARDTAYDVIYNIWKHSRPEGRSVEDDAAEGSLDGLPTARAIGFGGSEKGGPKRKVTQCACSKAGTHYANVPLEAVVSGTPEQIYNLMFQSGFIKDFMAQDQKLFDIQVSDWQPSPDNAQLLSRNMSYIKPLAGGFGPKQTKCELRDENQHVDFDDYVSTITTTRTPDVPSGGVFSVKTRTCIMWAGASSSRVTVTYAIEWTGKSFIKGIIEKGAGDGQLSYYKDLEVAMRKYIAENRKEFLPEGIDAAEADHEAKVGGAALSPTVAEHIDPVTSRGLPAPPQSPSSRALQWALDTFDGASKVAKDSFTGALDIIGDAVSGLDISSISFSRTTFLTVTVIVLIISNVYTILTMGEREAIGRRKALEKRGEEKDKWVGEAVRAFLEVQQSMSEAAVCTPSLPSPDVATPVLPTALADIKAEVKSLVEAADALERRIAGLKNQLEELD